jgi:hypothetical protein
VKKEGFNNLEEFRKAWIEINGSWNPEEIVTAYEFELVSSDSEETCGPDLF